MHIMIYYIIHYEIKTVNKPYRFIIAIFLLLILQNLFKIRLCKNILQCILIYWNLSRKITKAILYAGFTHH